MRDANGTAVPGVTAAVTWNLPSGQTTSKTATTNTKEVAALKVTNLIKTGYTFDPADSVLTKTVVSQ